jgi:putative membrane protein
MMWNSTCPLWNSGAFGSWSWVGMALNMLLWVGLLGGLIFLVFWLVQRARLIQLGSTASGPVPSGEPLPNEIIRLRYARGEITREQYLNLREDLE